MGFFCDIYISKSILAVNMGEILGKVESTCEHCLSNHAKYIVKDGDFVYFHCRNCTWELKEAQ